MILSTACISLGLFLAAGAASLKSGLSYRVLVGHSFKYTVATDKTDFAGSGNGKVTEHVNSATPIVFTVTSVGRTGGNLQVVTGPLIVRGRSVGRSREDNLPITREYRTSGRSPAPMFVLLPRGRARVGQSWNAPFYGPSPIPGNMVAHYRYAKNVGSYAEVVLKVTGNEAAIVDGSGILFLRRSDGLLEKGSALFNISYVRPDPNHKGKTAVNSHTVLRIQITP